jgi:hypothetical protein
VNTAPIIDPEQGAVQRTLNKLLIAGKKLVRLPVELGTSVWATVYVGKKTVISPHNEE